MHWGHQLYHRHGYFSVRSSCELGSLRRLKDSTLHSLRDTGSNDDCINSLATSGIPRCSIKLVSNKVKKVPISHLETPSPIYNTIAKITEPSCTANEHMTVSIPQSALMGTEHVDNQWQSSCCKIEKINESENHTVSLTPPASPMNHIDGNIGTAASLVRWRYLSELLKKINIPDLKNIDTKEIYLPLLPMKNDVLLSHDGRRREHRGNHWFKTLLLDNLEEYENSHIFKKRDLALKIVTIIQAAGGRFLQGRLVDDTMEWEIADDATAIKKVYKDFGKLRKISKAK